MTVAVGCIFVCIGLGMTIFTDRILRFYASRQRYQWAKDFFGSDIYSLFYFLGGVGCVIGGVGIIFFAVR